MNDYQAVVEALQEVAAALEKTRRLMMGIIDQNTHELERIEALLLTRLPPPPSSQKLSPPSLAVQRQIVKVVAELYGVPEVALLGPGRQRELIEPRHFAMFVLHDHFNVSYSSVAKLFGGRDHTTVMHAVQKVRVTEGGGPEKVLAAVFAAQSEHADGHPR